MVKVETFPTKYFGNITITSFDGDGDADVSYENQNIQIFLCEYENYGNKITECLTMLDKYVEINDIAKKAILENFSKDETVNYYFECHFDILEKEQLLELFGTTNFEEIDIKSVVNALKYPNLLFSIDDNQIELSVDYKLAKEYSDEILCVKIDEKLNITEFAHES